MSPADSLAEPDNVYAMSAADSLYVVYIPDNAECTLRVVGNNEYLSYWYNPVKGGELIPGDTLFSDSDGILKIYDPENINKNQDWSVIIKNL